MTTLVVALTLVLAAAAAVPVAVLPLVSRIRPSTAVPLLAAGSIVIVDDDTADAFTLAGLKGCVVISRGLLQALGPADQRMLTGHELSHLRRRHHLYVHTVDLAVAANPLILGAAGAVRLGVERWADEDAALCTSDRGAAAAALARTALIRASLRRGNLQDTGQVVPMLGAVTSHVTDRARALLAPTPRGTSITATVITLLLATFVATLACAVHVHDGFEHAELVWLTPAG